MCVASYRRHRLPNLVTLGDELEAHRMAEIALDRDPHNKKARAVLEATAPAFESWSKL